MSTIRTLTAEVDTRWNDEVGDLVPYVTLLIGNAKVVEWEVPHEDRHEMLPGYGHDPATAVDEFVARKLAAVFEAVER